MKKLKKLGISKGCFAVLRRTAVNRNDAGESSSFWGMQYVLRKFKGNHYNKFAKDREMEIDWGKKDEQTC